jgi:hypothetical protein
MTETRNGSIYKIICSKSNDVYVGSTFNALRTRMSQHKRSFNEGNGLAIYTAFKRHGWASLTMILIDTYEVVDRRHLEMYETLWFNKLRAVNRNCPFRIISNPKGAPKRCDIVPKSDRPKPTPIPVVRVNANEVKVPCECGGHYTIKRYRHFLAQHRLSNIHKEWINEDPKNRSYMPEATKTADKLMKKLFK